MGNQASDKLPDTLTPLSISQEQNFIQLPWGRLYSCLEGFQSVDLTQDTITLGRAEQCTIVINKNNFPESTIMNFSKIHFIIIRDVYTDLIYLKDESKNGTFINGSLVGKGNRYILQHDDILSVGFKGLQKLFVFKLLEIDESNKYLPTELRKKYKLSRFLGKGACGEVHLVFEKTTTKAYAIKKIKKGVYSSGNIYHLDHPMKIMNEVKILQSLTHPCVIKMKEIVETDSDVFIILEYMDGGDLTSRILSIRPLTEQNCKCLFYQITLAVQYLHSEGITHRDLKPDNILLANDDIETVVKLTDFGLSKFLHEYTVMKTICGTPQYVAPEIIDGSYKEYSFQVDVWSLGVILFYMLSKQLPFRSSERAVLNKLILTGQYSFHPHLWSDISYDVKDLISRMLVVDPKKRLTIDQVLQHRWIACDLDMQQRVAQIVQHGGSNSEYYNNDSDSQQPAPKKFKLLETTI